MTREIPHRYLQDNDGVTYYPRTDMEAVTGLSKDSTIVDINTKIDELNTTVDKVNTTVDKVNKTVETSNKTLEEQKKTLAEQKKIIEENKELLNVFDVILGDMVRDTGWMDIVVPEFMKNNANSGGFKSGLREVRVGNNLIPHRFTVRSIRLNVSNITGGSMQIAQLPTGFITDNQSFMARNNGYRHPITIECLNNGKVMAFVHPDDQSSTNWIYQEFTWLE